MITVEQVEELATALEASDGAERAKLWRLVRAYARIVRMREPKAFKPRACEYSDEDGHWDNTFPPDQVWKDKNGPATILVRKYTWNENATEGGFYHAWKAVPKDRGLYLDAKGRAWRGEITGEGRIGQFAAHPGNCDVNLNVDWSEASDDDVATEELRAAEEHLRGLAFPASVAA